MANVAHASLTGSNLHEPKGASTATAGQVYVADGAGSGAWTLASSLLTEAAWSTGDVKLTYKTSSDSGWIIPADGSIGSASSAATVRANLDCQNLFTLWWTNCTDANAPVSGGRGASAANDWAANKRITAPKTLGHALGIYGAGAGLTSRVLGVVAGSETHTLTTAQLPSHTHSFTATTDSSGAHSHTITVIDPGHTHNVSGGTVAGTGVGGLTAGGVASPTGTGTVSIATNVTGISATTDSQGTHTHTVSGTTNSEGSGTAHSIMQPTAFLNLMVKL